MDSSFKLFSRNNFFAVAFFAILVSLLWLVVSLLSPFLEDFIWAAILSLSFYPVYQRMHRWFGRRENLASALVTLLLLVALVVPGFFILMSIGQEARKAYEGLSTTPWEEKSEQVMEKLRGTQLQNLLEKSGLQLEKAEELLRKGIVAGVRSVPKMIGEKVTTVFKNLALFGLHLIFISVAIFFFFRDGPRFYHKLVEFLPLERGHREIAVQTVSKTVSAVLRGMVITALAQGLLAGAGFAVAGLPVPLLLGLLTFVNSFIPFLGAASVWIPSAIWLFTQDHYLAGLGLALYGACVISTVDNILKPLIIGEGTKIPVFLLFFTILGGLRVYGFLGILLGPVILALGMAFLSIYRDVYLKPALDSEKEESLKANPPDEKIKPPTG
jgi:predicted PurR-regulated permease PerM